MKFEELERKSVVILGFATEGMATYEFIRERWPQKKIGIADQRRFEQLDAGIQLRLKEDSGATLWFGSDYLNGLSNAEVIIKTPGIPASTVRQELGRQGNASAAITSHSAILLANYPRNRIVGITGTKGKSTTTSLIFEILRRAGMEAFLAGNIGSPPLPMLKQCTERSYLVHEFSSHQLAEVTHSPHIAVLLNIVPEHLDYYRDFAEYAAAKENITKYQSQDDFLVYNADYAEPRRIAGGTKAKPIPFSMSELPYGCFVRSGRIVWSDDGQLDDVMDLRDIPLLGAFNVQNTLAAVAVARLLGVPPGTIRDAVREFRALPHRLELVAEFRG